MQLLESFDKFKEYLRGKILFAEELGISDKTLTAGVNLTQGFLAKIVKPENPEEKLLQQLWLLGTEDERMALSSMLMKLIKTEDTGLDQKLGKATTKEVKH